MSGFNFGQIGNIISELFDTDYIDIKRDMNGELKEVYSNISCHLSYINVDNPDPQSVNIKPIIQSININLPTFVDVRNNDYLIAKRMDSNGNLLSTYSGRCGAPTMSQGRQKVLMLMSATESDTGAPVPAKEPIYITVKYLANNVSIMNTNTISVEKNTSFILNAPEIEGYKIESCEINNVVQDSVNVYIKNVTNNAYIVNFIYSINSSPTILRLLVNGVYTKDDGTLTSGYHFYKKISIDNIIKLNNVYTITCDDILWIHDDNGKSLTIAVGAEMILIPSNVFVKVIDIISVSNGKVTFKAEAFNPSENELNAYVTGWYD